MVKQRIDLIAPEVCPLRPAPCLAKPKQASWEQKNRQNVLHDCYRAWIVKVGIAYRTCAKGRRTATVVYTQMKADCFDYEVDLRSSANGRALGLPGEARIFRG